MRPPRAALLSQPHPMSKELVLTEVHPGTDPDDVQQSTGWDLAISEDLQVASAPSKAELAALRELMAR